MKRVAILTGGISSEREVSLWSSEMVSDVLREQFTVEVFDLPRELDQFYAVRDDFDVAIPVFHGPFGEDGSIQGFLKTLDVPFLFSGVEASAIGMNKHLAKLVAREAGLQTASGTLLKRGDSSVFRDPCVVKPLAGGSTIGVSIARTADEFEQCLQRAFEYADEVLVEAFIEGREFTVAVIEEGKETVALPVIEIVSEDGFFDFDQKYTDGKMAKEVCPAVIDDSLREVLQRDAVKVHRAIGARHVSRSDFIVDAHGMAWFLEINTIPGMTKNSLVPKAIRASGRHVASVFKDWIERL